MSRSLNVLAGGVLAASAMLPTAQAMALHAEVTGRVSGDTSGGVISVKDLHADNWVKGEYYRADAVNTQRTMWNKSGKSTTVTSGNGATIIQIHVCEDRDKAPDVCSAWVGKR